MKLTPLDVARFPRPGMAFPKEIAFSPSGRLVTFLHSEAGDLSRELFALDLETGERRVLLSAKGVGGGATDGNVSREEALRRERERLRETGITHYEWAEDADVLLVPVRGDLHCLRDGSARCVARGATDAHLSPDGRFVGFVRGGDLHVVASDGGPERRITFDAADGVTNGLAEFVAQEEMDRDRGFWFSRDGKLLAFARVDERHVPLLRIPHLAKGVLEAEEHRYPFAGAENVRVRLGVVPVEGGEVRWLDLGGAEYLARVAWRRDGALLAALESRDQRRLELVAFDPLTLARRTLLVEDSKVWINLNDDLREMESGEYVWASERTGWKHLYLYREERLVRPLTAGEWAVDAVQGWDARHVWFTASREGPLERHLYRVPLAGGEPERMTPEPGMHDAVVARGGRAFVDTHDGRRSPPRVTVRGEGGLALPLHEPEPFDLDPPDLISFAARDGTTLHGALWRPEGRGPFPLLVWVYGGPHVQLVQESWVLTAELRAQYLRSRGFLVLCADNRGSARRGLAFEGAIAGRTGKVEVEDQVDAVLHVAAEGLADKERVGIYGWSYGGYLALMALARAPGVFKAAVAGAPVTEWEGYDTHYTERYLGTPQQNEDGYRESSVLAHVEGMRGRLLLVHGMIDENVHFRHSARLLDALVKAGKPPDLLLFPDERHMPRSERDRAALEARIADWFEVHLAR